MFSSLVGKRTPNPNVTVIEHDALKEALRGNECVIVDVREPNEYSSGHIPGAINHPMSRFDAKLLPSGKRVVLVCQSGRTLCERRSKAVAAMSAITPEEHMVGGRQSTRQTCC